MTTNIILGYHSLPNHAFAYHAAHASGTEGAQFLSKRTGDAGAQVFFSITGDGSLGISFAGWSNVGHTNCDGFPGYHSYPYHSGPYHAGRRCGGIGAQFKALKTEGIGAQVRAAIYNTTNLRIMCEFPSRGDGSNWTASSTKASSTSSFDVLNLNTDIVEEYWRSDDAVVTGVLLDCDVGMGNVVFLDTLAFLNHNLTTSANVTLIGSDNSGHAPPGKVTVLQMEDQSDFVYVEPELPVVGYRYWRIAIDDATQPDNFLKIGTIVFGQALIFAGECFVDRVRKTPVNYADSIPTEGFTNVQNDRGIKNKIRLEFRNILYNGPNWTKLNDEVFLTARTILKCLWVPTPQFPLRFMTFAKMTRIPEQLHNVKAEYMDYVDFVIETDESK